MNVLVVGGEGISAVVRRGCWSGPASGVVLRQPGGGASAGSFARAANRGRVGRSGARQPALREHKIETVMHFAAFAAVGESVDARRSTTRTTWSRRLRCWKPCARNGCAQRVLEDHGHLRHTQPIADRRGYTAAADQSVRLLQAGDRAGAGGLCARVRICLCRMRYFDAAGTSTGEHGEDHTPETHLIPLVWKSRLGKGNRSRFWRRLSHAGRDLRAGLCSRRGPGHGERRSLERLTPGEGMHLNLGTGRAQRTGSDRDVSSRFGAGNSRGNGGRRPGDPPALYADAAHARRELDWQPRYAEIEQIVSTAWRWHSTHPRGYGA